VKTITKIGVLSLTKLLTFQMGVVGLILGILYSFGGAIIDALVSLDWISSSETPGLSYGTILAFGALLAMPFLGAVCGLIIGPIVAILYNISAEKIGGLKIDFEN